jgi:hypothetical protein
MPTPLPERLPPPAMRATAIAADCITAIDIATLHCMLE